MNIIKKLTKTKKIIANLKIKKKKHLKKEQNL